MQMYFKLNNATLKCKNKQLLYNTDTILTCAMQGWEMDMRIMEIIPLVMSVTTVGSQVIVRFLLSVQSCNHLKNFSTEISNIYKCLAVYSCTLAFNLGNSIFQGLASLQT